MALTALDFHVTHATADDVAALNLALSYLGNSPTASAIMQQVADMGVTINIVHDGKDQYYHDPDLGNTIDWDPNSALAVQANISGIGAVGVQSAALGLAHEGAHATDPTPLDIQNIEIPNYD